MKIKEFSIKNYVVYGKKDYALPTYFVNVESIEKTGRYFEGHIKPHVHSNLFQIIFFENGKGDFKSDHINTSFSGPCLFTVPENSRHEIQFDMNHEFCGKVLTLNTSLLEELMSDLPNSLLRITNSIRYVTTIENYHELDRFIDLINDCLPENNPRTRVAINAHLSLLLLKLLDLEGLNSTKGKLIKKQSYLYFRSFEQNVKDTQSISKSLSEYADKLKITPTHLNRICKTNVGLTASQVIQNFIIHEVKRNLLYTSYTVSEIAHKFNFKDLGYFCRFFKKHTGETPKNFRLIHHETEE